jgi:hypothetical protein
MIDLSQPTEPYELELPYGLKITVRPLTTAGMAAAQAAARRAVEAIERQAPRLFFLSSTVMNIYRVLSAPSMR